MRHHSGIRLVAVVSLVLGVGATAGPADAARLLRRTVVVGDSILAGFGNGGLVARGQTGQRDSAPALIARRAHVALPQPLMSGPGLPPPYRIEDANQNGVLEPDEVRRHSDDIGFRSDADKKVRNLAVPGESISTVFERLDTQGFAEELVSGDPSGRDIMKFLILGLPLQDDSVSQVSRAKELAPSFLLVWLGNNDVLDLATGTNPQGAELTPAEFGVQYRRLLNALADTNAPMAVANIPDVTNVAALRRAGQQVTTCKRADGTVSAVLPDDLLSIDLDRTLLPEPPCSDVLNAEEKLSIRGTVQAYNAEIAAAIAEVEVSRNVPIASIDVFAAFDDYAANGVDVRGDGSLVLTTSYLGGIFGLDGVHPTRTGQALIANAFIDAINLRFGEVIPRVDVARVAARDPLVGNRFQPPGEVPFGIIADEDGSDVLTASFREIGDDAGNIGSDLADDVGDFFDDLF
ncbi:MAG TPA: SGNH/GDSL hydrolase family protein [Candidatus Binatia bacterium]|jgi:lysophospholipase L1-like esterase|nr:SGNH/GDSL hydrolase family protein [Candidatus Binatia bacterium]